MGNPYGPGYALRVPNLGMPKRMIATLRQGIQGYLPAASAATGSATVLANAFFEPFTTSTPLTTGWASLNLTDASSMAGAFNGSTFYNTGFGSYRVHSSKLTVTSVTGTGGDTLNIWFFPGSYPLQTSATKYQEAIGLPGCQRMMVTAGMRPESRVSSIKPYQLLGRTKVEYDTDPNTAAPVASQPATSSGVAWQINYATLDGAVTGGQCYFDFQLEIEVEFFEPISTAA